MATKAGVILSYKAAGAETKYCVVVQRFYPQIPHIEIDCGGIRLSNVDIVNGLKIFVRGKREGGRFLPHPDLYVKLPDSHLLQSLPPGARNLNNNLFDFKIGFPKGEMNPEDGNDRVCAKRELEEETGIIIGVNDLNVINDANGVEKVFGRDVKYFEYNINDAAHPAQAEPGIAHKHEISSVHFLTLGELNYLERYERSHIARITSEVIRHLNPPQPAQPVQPAYTDNIRTILSSTLMDDDLYQKYVQAVAHAKYLRSNTNPDQFENLLMEGGGKKYRQKGGELEKDLTSDELFSVGGVIELFNLMLTNDRDTQINDEDMKTMIENLTHMKTMIKNLKNMEKTIIHPEYTDFNPITILLENLKKQTGGGTRKNKKSRRNRNNRNSNKRTKRK